MPQATGTAAWKDRRITSGSDWGRTEGPFQAVGLAFQGSAGLSIWGVFASSNPSLPQEREVFLTGPGGGPPHFFLGIRGKFPRERESA